MLIQNRISTHCESMDDAFKLRPYERASSIVVDIEIN